MKIKAIIIATFLTAILNTVNTHALPLDKTADDVERCLSLLDYELTQAEIYKQKFKAAADGYRRQLHANITPLDSARICEKMASLYMSHNIDTIFHYLNTGYDVIAKERNDATIDSMRIALTLRISAYMPALGIQNEAIMAISQIDTTKLSVPLLTLYYESTQQMWRYIRDLTPAQSKVRAQAIANVKAAQMRHMALLPHNTTEYMLARGKQYYENREYTKAQPIFDLLIDSESDSSHIYAISTYFLAKLAQANDDINGYKYYLTQSAIADIRSCTLENASLGLLGQQLFEDGDIERARIYLTTALANAIDCNSRMRTVENAKILQFINNTHDNTISKWRNTSYIIIGITALLIIILITVLIYMRNESIRVKNVIRHHDDVLKTKDTYMSEFVNLCALFNTTNQYCRIIQRKITSGKTDELQRLMKGNKELDENAQKFYDVFDNAFLLIYPDFPKQVNALLRPDEQIELTNGERMNTELRILAFMRMGITDAARMAQVLNYSVNTIYTYRNRLRNKAINRDTFEEEITRIRSID